MKRGIVYNIAIVTARLGDGFASLVQHLKQEIIIFLPFKELCVKDISLFTVLFWIYHDAHQFVCKVIRLLRKYSTRQCLQLLINYTLLQHNCVPQC